MAILEQYRAIKQQAAIGAVSPCRPIAVRGKDRATYLHGLLTNDVRALAAGTGCYAAWLTPQGRMLTDMHVFETGDMMLLDVPEQRAAAILQRLDQYLFSEDVQVEDLAAALSAVWIHGPDASVLIEQVVAGASGLMSWTDYRHASIEYDGSAARIARVDQLGVPGFVLYVSPATVPVLVRALDAAGATHASVEAIDAARIEAGYPVFGVDMTDDTIPLEAGIEDRAISFTKGCYVGQEVIVRVLHRGHGRVARKLVGLRIDGDVPPRGAKLFAGEREAGWVTSAANSPASGAIALGYVQRDFVPPGTRLEVQAASGRVAATVSSRPLSSTD
jgi:folate-binding protein YgfZ